MATRVWLGAAQVTAQVDSVTPANVNIGNTFTVTVNNKEVTFTATAATVANVTAGLSAAITAAAATDPEFAELTATDNTTNILVTGPSDGTPFTLTASATGGTATNTRAAVTTPSSPNDWGLADNWSGGAVPITGDDVIVPANRPDVLYGLAQSGVTLASLDVAGNIGLPDRNARGYSEYRATYLAVSATALRVRGGNRVRINTGSNATGVVVYDTGTPLDQDGRAFLWKGAHATNTVDVVAGSVGLADLAGETATVATLRVGADSDGRAPDVRGGPGLTLTTLSQAGGVVVLQAGLTTVTKTAGALTIIGPAGTNVTTVNNDGGDFIYQAVGTIGTLRVSDGGLADFSRDPRARNVTDTTVYAGAELRDPFRTVTWTNPIVLHRCGLEDVTIDLGTHITLAVAAGP